MNTLTAPPVIRRAQSRDLEVVGELTVAAYSHDGHVEDSEPYLEELRAAGERAERAELWVATLDDQVVGSVTFCPEGSPYRELASAGEGEFRMLAVAPETRGRGVARALVQRCLARSRELECSSVVLCSMPTMTSAHRLYESFGFSRDPDLDWEPAPGVVLWGYRADIGT
ncbi:MAG: GNAT family N-acetyltransferase [Nocardioidaceae bacterium]